MSTSLEKTDFEALLLACQELGAMFPDGLVYIGGIAVYLHAVNNETARPLAEFTHDADFYISISDMSDLRDLEEVVPNRRLSRHQITKRGFEFDIYTERHSALIIPYDQVIAHSRQYDRIKVASLEHLLVLKLEAYRDRFASTKGQKDAKDIVRIGIVATNQEQRFNSDLVVGFLSDAHVKLLQKIQHGPEILALAKGNAKLAKTFRIQFSKIVAAVEKQYS